MLPIESYLDKIVTESKSGRDLIIKAQPGAGKTTCVPDALQKECQERVIVVQPRRLAAVLSARRVASQRGQPVGDSVGYHVRYDRQVSKQTNLLFVTEGIFLHKVSQDPTLKSVDILIIDEFHERRFAQDLILSWARMLKSNQRRPRLVVMSATLDSLSLKKYLPDSYAFDVPGQVFPVKISYLAENADESLSLEEKVVRGVTDMLAQPEPKGNILVFLPGVAEILACQKALSTRFAHVDVLPLYSELSKDRQETIFQHSNRRKVVLSTNVAETSLTLPNITGVIDSGLAKIASYAPWSGLSVLETKAICQSSIEQRTGRAGRTAEGICYRLFKESDYLRRPRD